MKKLPSKTYVRVYVQREEDIEKVNAIMSDIDPYEFEYIPTGLVTTFSNYPEVVYTGKFDDMDMDKVCYECWVRGIPIWVHISDKRGK